MLRVRFTVRGMMVVVATLAVTWALFFGIAHLTVYRDHLEYERHARQAAATLEAQKSDALAAEWRTRAEEAARLTRENGNWVATLLGLVGLGVASAGLGIVLRRRPEPASSARSRAMESIVAACSTVAKVVLVASILAGILYAGLFVLVVLTWDD
jgi:hypothetical protein